MIEKLKITLWDVLSLWILGVAIIIDFKILTDLKFIPSFASVPQMLCWENIPFLVILTYIIGALFEPVSNWIFDGSFGVDNLYKKFFFSKMEDESNYFKNNFQPKLKDMIKKIYDVDLSGSYIYHFAKDYILENELGTTFMSFLSKYGFYRSITVLLLFNIVVLLVNVQYSFQHPVIYFSVLLILFFLSLFSYKRAKEFFLFMGRTVFNNFVIGHREQLKISQ